MMSVTNSLIRVVNLDSVQWSVYICRLEMLEILFVGKKFDKRLSKSDNNPKYFYFITNNKL